MKRFLLLVAFVAAGLVIGSAATSVSAMAAAEPAPAPTSTTDGSNLVVGLTTESPNEGDDGIIRVQPAPKVVITYVPCRLGLAGCALASAECADAARFGAEGLTGVALVQVQIVDGQSTVLGSFQCETESEAVPAGPQLPTLVRDELVKRVPAPAVKTSGPPAAEPTTLVNLQTILWVDTGTDRDLGTFTLLGQQVGLRVHLSKVSWDFGDGETDTTTEPGHPYDEHWHKCDTKLCPDYYGHIYRQPGHLTVRATVTWTGQYQLNGGDWTDIDGTADGATTELPIWIREAHAVLVPNPGD